jgi:hypothetical protein
MGKTPMKIERRHIGVTVGSRAAANEPLCVMCIPHPVQEMKHKYGEKKLG